MTIQNTDAYKLSHKGFMDEGTTLIYSNMTARSFKHMPVLKDRFDNKIVVFGIQRMIKDLLIKDFGDNFFNVKKSKAIAKMKRRCDNYLGKDSVPMDHFEQLHDLGYLPVQIKAIDEGYRVNEKVAFLTIQNTHDDFAWLVNFLETVISAELWKPMTVATIAYEYRRLCDEYAIKTTGSTAGVEFQCHDFSFRGMSNRQDAANCGAGHLLSFVGTDSVPAIDTLEDYYNVNVENEFVACSVPASEHMIACLGTSNIGELESYRRWITESYPTGLVSLVSDTYDFFRVVTEYATILKDDILNRKPDANGMAKVVFRPDTGIPEDIICGIDVDYSVETRNDAWESGSVYYIKDEDKYFRVNDISYFFDFKPNLVFTEVSKAELKGAVECLWDVFGGTETEQGYKVLHERVGLIYGDSITLERAREILKRLEQKGFASTNIVFGVGSFSYGMLSRDSAGMAIKATYAEVNGKGLELFKDPITDLDGTKKSAKGLLRVEREGVDFVMYDQQTEEQETQGMLDTVFINGELTTDWHFREIQIRMFSS